MEKLDTLIDEVRTGKREGSVVTDRSTGSLSADEKEEWRQLRKELESVGITPALFNQHRELIIERLKAIGDGDLAEDIGEELSNTTRESTEEQYFEIKSTFTGNVASGLDGGSIRTPKDSMLKWGIRMPPKPTMLKLETNNVVEPARCSAGMMSLRAAHFISVQSQGLLYPEGIRSPNPMLNHGSKIRRHYDKDFLLQFQDVFKEKPSMDWDKILKETVGDSSESARHIPPRRLDREAGSALS